MPEITWEDPATAAAEMPIAELPAQPARNHGDRGRSSLEPGEHRGSDPGTHAPRAGNWQATS